MFACKHVICIFVSQDAEPSKACVATEPSRKIAAATLFLRIRDKTPPRQSPTSTKSLYAKTFWMLMKDTQQFLALWLWIYGIYMWIYMTITLTALSL